MRRQQRLQLEDTTALVAPWTRFTDEQRKQVIAIFAELIARAAHNKKEQPDDAVGK